MRLPVARQPQCQQRAYTCMHCGRCLMNDVCLLGNLDRTAPWLHTLLQSPLQTSPHREPAPVRMPAHSCACLAGCRPWAVQWAASSAPGKPWVDLDPAAVAQQRARPVVAPPAARLRCTAVAALQRALQPNVLLSGLYLEPQLLSQHERARGHTHDQRTRLMHHRCMRPVVACQQPAADNSSCKSKIPASVWQCRLV